MKELRQKIDEIVWKHVQDVSGSMDYNQLIEELYQTVLSYFKQTGKQGGESTKKKNPDYSAIGKKGAEKRWRSKERKKA